MFQIQLNKDRNPSTTNTCPLLNLNFLCLMEGRTREWLDKCEKYLKLFQINTLQKVKGVVREGMGWNEFLNEGLTRKESGNCSNSGVMWKELGVGHENLNKK